MSILNLVISFVSPITLFFHSLPLFVNLSVLFESLEPEINWSVKLVWRSRKLERNYYCE